MKKLRQLLIDLGILLGVMVLVFVAWKWLLPKPQENQNQTQSTQVSRQAQTSQKKAAQKVKAQHKRALRMVAVGDSLTHGVGDEAKQGGYVPLVAAKIKQATNRQVTTQNYGVTGDKSTQILKRIQQQTKLQTSLKQADLITVTVGGNDLMAVLQNNLMDLNQKQIKTGQQTFQKHLLSLIGEIRQLNANAPIFILGVYNPFYVYFPQITGMTTAVQLWNETTQTVAKDYRRTYYINSNRWLTHGDGHYVKQQKSAETMTTAQFQKVLKENEHLNPYISDDDHFHPNHAGYVRLTKGFWKVIKAHQTDWLKGTN